MHSLYDANANETLAIQPAEFEKSTDYIASIQSSLDDIFDALLTKS